MSTRKRDAKQVRARSERYLVVHVVARAGAGHGGLTGRSAAARGIRAAVTGAKTPPPAAAPTAPAAGAVQHGELGIEALQYHLGGIAVLTGLILPFARL